MGDALSEAFKGRMLITAKHAAGVLGIDVKTLGRLAIDGAIQSVFVGKTRRFTEAGLRAFLRGETACPTIDRKTPSSTTVRSGPRLMGFTESVARRAKKEGRG